jgi:hypothetical protein
MIKSSQDPISTLISSDSLFIVTDLLNRNHATRLFWKLSLLSSRGQGIFNIDTFGPMVNINIAVNEFVYQGVLNQGGDYCYRQIIEYLKEGLKEGQVCSWLISSCRVMSRAIYISQEQT